MNEKRISLPRQAQILTGRSAWQGLEFTSALLLPQVGVLPQTPCPTYLVALPKRNMSPGLWLNPRKCLCPCKDPAPQSQSLPSQAPSLQVMAFQ